MSLSFTTTEIFTRISATDNKGVEHSALFPMNWNDSFGKIWEALHSRADGELPTEEDLGHDLYRDVVRLHFCELDLEALVNREAETEALVDVPL